MTIDHPDATPQHRQLAMILRGRPEGMTRKQIETELGVLDRVARDLVHDLTAWAALPLICDRSGGGEGRYRVAKNTAEDRDLVNKELGSLGSYGISTLRRERGLRIAYEQAHHVGSLFLAQPPDLSKIEGAS